MREYLDLNNCAESSQANQSKQEKAAVFVSSNAYYGYQQPHVCGVTEAPMQVMEHEGASPVRLPCRKRPMENSTAGCVNNGQWGECKKRRENDGGEYSQASSNTILSNQHHHQTRQYHLQQNNLTTYQTNQPYNMPMNRDNFQQNEDHVQMEVTPEESSNNNNDEKRKENESTQHNKGRVKNYRLEEELLRGTHGCTYYHWITSNIL